MPHCLPSTPAALSVLDKVNIGGAVAPVLRRRTITKRRPIHVVNGEGKVVRMSDDIEVAKGVLAHADIAFSVIGTPSIVSCARCRAMFSRQPNERFTVLCSSCRKTRIRYNVVVRLQDEELVALDRYLATTSVDIVRPVGTWEGVFGWLVRAVRNSTCALTKKGITVRLTQEERDVLDALVERANRAVQKHSNVNYRFSLPRSFGRAVRLVLLDGKLLSGEEPHVLPGDATCSF